ncbi:hypothetical protein D3C79_1049040 [compost metagenome]
MRGEQCAVFDVFKPIQALDQGAEGCVGHALRLLDPVVVGEYLQVLILTLVRFQKRLQVNDFLKAGPIMGQ